MTLLQKKRHHMTLLRASVGLVPLGLQSPAHLFWLGPLLPGELLPCKEAWKVPPSSSTSLFEFDVEKNTND